MQAMDTICDMWAARGAARMLQRRGTAMTEPLTFPDLQQPAAFARCIARSCSVGVLSAEVEGQEQAVRALAARMQTGPLRAQFGLRSIKLLRFTVLDQGTPSRLVFLADYRRHP